MKKLTELGKWRVGQEVLLNEQNVRSTHIIYSITDENAGTIYLKNSAFSFDFNGRINSVCWPNSFIEPISPDTKENIIRAGRRARLQNFDFSSLSLDQASDLVFKMREMGIVI